MKRSYSSMMSMRTYSFFSNQHRQAVETVVVVVEAPMRGCWMCKAEAEVSGEEDEEDDGFLHLNRCSNINRGSQCKNKDI